MDSPLCALHLSHYRTALWQMQIDKASRIIHTSELPAIDVDQKFSTLALNDQQQPCLLWCYFAPPGCTPKMAVRLGSHTIFPFHRWTETWDWKAHTPPIDAASVARNRCH